MHTFFNVLLNVEMLPLSVSFVIDVHKGVLF